MVHILLIALIALGLLTFINIAGGMVHNWPES